MKIKYFYQNLLVLGCATAVMLTTSFLDIEKTTSAPMGALDQLTKNIKIPLAANELGSTYLLNRGGAVTLTRSFNFHGEINDIRSFYQHESIKHSWSHIYAKKIGSIEHVDKFCSDVMVISLDVQSVNMDGYYSISIGWSDRKSSRYYCRQDIVMK